MRFVIGLISIILYGAVADPNQVCDATDSEGTCLESTKDAQHSMLQKGFAHASTAHAPKEHHAKHHAESKDVAEDAHTASKSGKHAEKVPKNSEFDIGESGTNLIVTQEVKTTEKGASVHKKSKVKGKAKETDSLTQHEGKGEAKHREENKHQDSIVVKGASKKRSKSVKMAQTASHSKGITKPVKR